MTDQNGCNAIKGWFLGCVVAAAVLTTFALFDFVRAQLGPAEFLVGLPLIFLLCCALIVIFSALPSALFILITNWLKLRQFMVFLGFGTALGKGFAYLFKAPPAFAWQLTLAGLAAGLVYWLFVRRETMSSL